MAKDGEKPSGDHGNDVIWGAIDRQQQQLEEIRTMLKALTITINTINARLPTGPDPNDPPRDDQQVQDQQVRDQQARDQQVHEQQVRDQQARDQQAREPKEGNHPGRLQLRRAYNNPVHGGDLTDEDLKDLAIYQGPREPVQNNNNYRMKMDLPSFNEFQRLQSRNDLPETEGQLVARFVGGLRYAIQDVVNMQPVHTLQDAIQLATRVEMQSNRKGGFRNQPTNRTFTLSPDKNQLKSNKGKGVEVVQNQAPSSQNRGPWKNQQNTKQDTGGARESKGTTNPYAPYRGDNCVARVLAGDGLLGVAV
ncbi:hypothetical protein Vadar_016576 [Vaccinium darrowii]|uniref:Uncharacterized protein n=1 Tax=Vaccinium darrowii TaxID=229202 RepID=A0ACB7YEA1_9ERIC|nr:hypothetical protein Vadar_016576 [Vaccinium darrowii]